MPLDGFVRDWEPRPERRDLYYVVAPHFGPKGGRGPYRNRWTIDALFPDGWHPMCSLIAPNKQRAHAAAFGLVRKMGEWTDA